MNKNQSHSKKSNKRKYEVESNPKKKELQKEE